MRHKNTTPKEQSIDLLLRQATLTEHIASIDVLQLRNAKASRLGMGAVLDEEIELAHEGYTKAPSPERSEDASNNRIDTPEYPQSGQPNTTTGSYGNLLTPEDTPDPFQFAQIQENGSRDRDSFALAQGSFSNGYPDLRHKLTLHEDSGRHVEDEELIDTTTALDNFPIAHVEEHNQTPFSNFPGQNQQAMEMTRSRRPYYDYVQQETDNDASRQNEISADIDPRNIIPGPLTRRTRKANAFVTLELPLETTKLALATALTYSKKAVAVLRQRSHFARRKLV